MGTLCSKEESNFKKLQKILLKYFGYISPKVEEYRFDSLVTNQFAARVAKENDTNVQVTKAWIKYYTAYMIYVGWLYAYENKKNVFVKPNRDLKVSLAIPFEILQVWKCHVLFTDKYREFCLIISNGRKDFIPFEPQKKYWKEADMFQLYRYFHFNKQILLTFYPTDKKEIDSLFIFQSSYLKNCISFNLEDNSEILLNIVKKFNEELAKENGIFKITARNFSTLHILSSKLETLINSAIVPENYPGGEDWVLLLNDLDKSRADRAALKKPLFENFKLPKDFLKRFADEHILGTDKASQYVDNYRKFIFLIAVTEKPHTPSEEVDLVWHYHQLHLEEYIKFSKDVLGKPILSHNPAIGEKDESIKFKDLYQNTINNLILYFGSANPNIWPESNKRFNQIFRYFNHHTILQRCENYKKKNNQNTFSIKSNEVFIIPGCYIGCGFLTPTKPLGCTHSGCATNINSYSPVNVSKIYMPHNSHVIYNACSNHGIGCHGHGFNHGTTEFSGKFLSLEYFYIFERLIILCIFKQFSLLWI